MGDVFDALNRAGEEKPDPKKRPQPEAEQGALESAKAEASTASTPDEAPSLPIEEFTSETQAETGSGITGSVPAEPKAPEPKAEESKSPEQPLGAEDSDIDPRFAATVADAQAKAVDEGAADRSNAMAIELPNGSQDPSLNGYATDVIVHHDRGSPITEQYRQIRTQILARGRNRKLQTHVITSSAPGEGKSVTSVNLGITFAELRNQKTLLIEGDLRRPSFKRILNRSATPGLVQLLRGEEENIENCLHETVYDNMQILPAGDHEHESSTQLLSSPRMLKVLEQCKDRYDHIFIDSPPVITVTDACILGAHCDETLLVVRMHKTQTDVVERAKRLLRASNCELAGVILTHLVNETLPRYLYRYQYK